MKTFLSNMWLGAKVWAFMLALIAFGFGLIAGLIALGTLGLWIAALVLIPLAFAATGDMIR